MTPKEKAEEKAKELIEKHLECFDGRYAEEFDHKKAALITVEEIIRELDLMHKHTGVVLVGPFWENVKTEIRNS